MRKLILIFAIMSCTANKNHQTPPPVTFSELWKVDKCGTMGYRSMLVKFIEKDRLNSLNNKNIDYVDKYFGSPNRIDTNYEWKTIHYWYNCSAESIDSSGRCGEDIDVSFIINIDYLNTINSYTTH